MTAVDVLLTVAQIGGKLGVLDGGMLRTLLPADCPASLKAEIKANKAALLELLAGPPFLIVRSDALQSKIVFWTADEAGRDLLMKHGATRGSIWTYAELDRVARLNLSADGLKRLHSVKRTFQGRIVEP